MPCICAAPPFPFLLFLLFFPPSYTHRHHCELARAPGGSAAGRPFFARPFVWGISKIDCAHAARVPGSHADPALCHERGMPPQSAWEAPAGLGSPLGPREGEGKSVLQGSPYPAPIWPPTLQTTYPISTRPRRPARRCGAPGGPQRTLPRSPLLVAPAGTSSRQSRPPAGRQSSVIPLRRHSLNSSFEMPSASSR